MQLPCLDIIIPHYKEKPSMIRHLLDSIEGQVGIDVSKAIKVTIVNDKNDDAYCDLVSFLQTANYSFPVEVLQTEKNQGAGRARQFGIEHTSCPYIMFCDADDNLYTCMALSALLNRIRLLETQQKPWNYVWGNFYEEKIIEMNGRKGYDIIEHKTPTMIWLHGKIFNRSFIDIHKIAFHPSLRTFEDTYFGKIVALSAPKSWASHVDEYVYFWRKNPNSVTANWNHDKHSYLYWRNGDYLECTYSVLATLYPHADKVERWNETFCVSLMFTYFMLQFGEFNDGHPITDSIRVRLEELFVDIVRDFSDAVKNLSNLQKVKWYSLARYEVANQFSFNIEQVGWNDFLQYLDKKYNINSYDLLKIDNLTYDM